MRLNKDISFHVKPDLGIRHDLSHLQAMFKSNILGIFKVDRYQIEDIKKSLIAFCN